MPAIAVSLNLVGQPVYVYTLTGAFQEFQFSTVNRVSGKVQLLAEDAATLAPVAFLFSDAAAGIVGRSVAGSPLILPVIVQQSWFVKQDSTSPGAILRILCVA